MRQAAGTLRRALVTGAAGFLGSHLVARLLRDGVDVHGVSRLERSTRPRGTHPVRAAADVERTRALLAWHPTITLDDGLGRTIAWYRGQEVAS